MNKMDSEFEIIIPLLWDGQIIELEKHFVKRDISNTPQLEGSILMDKENSPLNQCFELKQEYRRKIGIHQNEGYKYCLLKEGIPFKIGKIKLWCFKTGVAFFTIHLSANDITEHEELDLVATLCLVYQKSKIKYTQKLGKYIAEEKVFTIKDLVQNLVDQIDGLQPFSHTYKMGKCLFYGYGKADSENNINTFLAKLRTYSKSSRKLFTEASTEHFYRYYDYINWAISEHVIAAYGNLKQCGSDNAFFLTDDGGLKQTIFSNYLVIFLTILSVHLKLQILCLKYNIHNPSGIHELPEEILNEFYVVLNIPYPFTGIEHIDQMFREKYCVEILNLPDRISAFKSIEIMGELKSINVRLNSIENQLSRVVEIVDGDIKPFIEEEKKKAEQLLLMIQQREERDLLISKYIESISSHINVSIQSETDLINENEKKLKDLFGETWEKLLPVSRTSLVSATVLWESCKTITSQKFDFSGICISSTSALEAELKKVFFVGFQDFMEMQYGAPQNKTTFEIWPEILLSSRKGDFEKRRNSGQYIQVKRNKDFTLGMLPYLFGQKEKKASPEQEKLVRLRMGDYLKTIVNARYRNNDLIQLFFKEKSSCLVRRTEMVREKYRNPSAHSQIINRKKASECYTEIVGNHGNCASDAVGLLVELYKYLK